MDLATNISENKDHKAIGELIDLLKNNKLAGNCIKVLYEVGERAPELIEPYLENFVKLLEHKNNRLQWGAMTAIRCISAVAPEKVQVKIPVLMKTGHNGSVISRDQLVKTLIVLGSKSAYRESAQRFLIEILRICPDNQLPMYAEESMRLFEQELKGEFIQVLHERLLEFEKVSKRKRIEKVLRKLGK